MNTRERYTHAASTFGLKGWEMNLEKSTTDPVYKFRLYEALLFENGISDRSIVICLVVN